MDTTASKNARKSLANVPLSEDERARLGVLNAATSQNAPAYQAVLAIMIAAKDRYQLQVRTDEIAAELSAAGLDTGNLTQHLEQLREWGAVTWTQDTGRVARLEDFKRKRELWQVTPAGHATHDSVLRVLGAAERSGSLQRALFRDISENLQALAKAIDAADATATYLRLRDLDGALTDLAANAREFHASMALLRQERELNPETFLAYKHLMIDYLQRFLDDLIRYRLQIAGAVERVEDRGLLRLGELAAAGDDSGGIFVQEDLSHIWLQRWKGLASWFRSERHQEQTGVEELHAATTVAIRDLMTFLRKLTESSTRPITRGSELIHLARWFQRCDESEARLLFDAAFGLAAPQHIDIAHPDPELISASTSWWDAEPVDVPVTLRLYGRASPVPPAQAVLDFSATRRHLSDQHERRRHERMGAAATLAARPLDGRILSRGEFTLLLELLNRCLHKRPMTGAFKVDVDSEGVRLILASSDSTAIVCTEAGTLNIANSTLEVQPA